MTQHTHTTRYIDGALGTQCLVPKLKYKSNGDNIYLHQLHKIKLYIYAD